MAVSLGRVLESSSQKKAGTVPGLLSLPLAALAAAAVTASAYWPGLMSWDPVRQYGQALSGDIDDWHPPAMEVVWQQLLMIHPGPAPMLLLQLGLYWGGLALLAMAIWKIGRHALAWGLLACGLFPIGLALSGMIFKDSLMCGVLLVSTGLLACSFSGRHALPRLMAGALLLFAATLRFNAFSACLPLMIALLPRGLWNSPVKLSVTVLVTTATLMLAMPVANRLIGAKASGVELSLVIFDLGGITEHSGVSVFPEEMEVNDPVRVNHGCYQPNKWDSYSFWAARECPLGYTAWNDNVDPNEIRAYPFWLQAVLAHPLAYAEHRLNHFALNTRLLPLSDATERPVPSAGAPNPWGFHVTPNGAMRLLDQLAIATAHTPLGWPIVSIALALAALIASPTLPDARLIVPVALSSLLYGCGYLVFSVAAELRYHLWTSVAALIATVLVLSAWKTLSWKRLICAYAPVALVIAVGLIARL